MGTELVTRPKSLSELAEAFPGPQAINVIAEGFDQLLKYRGKRERLTSGFVRLLLRLSNKSDPVSEFYKKEIEISGKRIPVQVHRISDSAVVSDQIFVDVGVSGAADRVRFRPGKNGEAAWVFLGRNVVGREQTLNFQQQGDLSLFQEALRSLLEEELDGDGLASDQRREMEDSLSRVKVLE